LSLFALDPANTARGCRACCHSDDRVVPHQPHWTFTRSDGRHAARRPDARRDRWSRTHADHNAGSDTMQQNAAPSRLSLFALDPANTARGCRACCHSDDRVVPHQPHWTFTRSDGRHAARRPDARKLQWSRTHADHNAGSDTVQLLQRQAGHLNHSKAASRCVIRKNKAIQNMPLNTLRAWSVLSTAASASARQCWGWARSTFRRPLLASESAARRACCSAAVPACLARHCLSAATIGALPSTEHPY